MKNFVIILIALCFTQTSFSQSVKSIRVNNSVQGHSWSYSISDIDSIAYDVYSQVQKIYINGDCKETLLEDVDSVSFSAEEAINVVISNDYIAEATSYIFSNGVILAVKEDSIQGKILIVDSLDVATSQWSEDKSFMIYCDSTYKPLIAKNSQYIYYFEYDVNENLIEVNTTDLEGNAVYPTNVSPRKNAICRVSTEGCSTVDDISAALTIYDIYNSDPNKNIAGTVVSWMTKLFPAGIPAGIPRDIAELLPNLCDALKGNKLGILGTILSYMKLNKSICENRTKALIGDCTPYIKSVYKEGDNSAVINVQISGVSSTTQRIPYYVICYWQEVNGKRTNVTHTTNPIKATNGIHPVKIENLKGGKYGFQVLIFPDLFLERGNLYRLYNFRSNIAYVNIAPIHFKVLEPNFTTYADGYVTVSMKAVLDFPSLQDETILSYYDSYGVYYHYDDNVNQREEYFSVKENGSKEFYITLDIPREDFLYDYNNFVATCANKIIFKTYTINGYGIKKFYDEQELKIVYDEKPSITFTDANLGPTTHLGYINGYTTEINVNYKITGSFWGNTIDAVVIYGDANDLLGFHNAMSDGEHSYRFYYQYGANDDNIASAFKMDIVFANGNRVSSTNSVRMSGLSTITNIAIVNDVRVNQVSNKTREKIPSLKNRPQYILIRKE